MRSPNVLFELIRCPQQLQNAGPSESETMLLGKVGRDQNGSLLCTLATALPSLLIPLPPHSDRRDCREKFYENRAPQRDRLCMVIRKQKSRQEDPALPAAPYASDRTSARPTRSPRFYSFFSGLIATLGVVPRNVYPTCISHGADYLAYSSCDSSYHFHRYPLRGSGEALHTYTLLSPTFSRPLVTSVKGIPHAFA